MWRCVVGRATEEEGDLMAEANGRRRQKTGQVGSHRRQEGGQRRRTGGRERRVRSAGGRAVGGGDQAVRAGGRKASGLQDWVTGMPIVLERGRAGAQGGLAAKEADGRQRGCDKLT